MYSNDEIKRFQDNIILIRKVLGFSEKELGDSIGVTRQTINNIENKKTKLTKTQYLAMRKIIMDEREKNNEENKILVCVLDAIVDNPQDYTAEQRKNILEKANLLAPAIITKSNTKKEASIEYLKLLGILGGGSIVIGGIVGKLIEEVFKGKK